MEIPTCNYKYLDNEFYVKSIKNDNYVPYVFGFVISISGIGLLISIYNANLEYKQEISNKIKLVLYIILILIFLGLLGYSGYEIGIYNTKDLTKTYSADELIRPCYSKHTKKIYGLRVAGFILQEEGLSSYSNNDTLNNSVSSNQLNPSEGRTRTVTTPYNTRTSNANSTTTGNATPGSTTLNSTANSNANLGNRTTFTNNSAPPTSTIGTTNVQQATQNSTGTTDQRIIGGIEDGGSLIARGP